MIAPSPAKPRRARHSVVLALVVVVLGLLAPLLSLPSAAAATGDVLPSTVHRTGGPSDPDFVRVPESCAGNIGREDPRQKWQPCWLLPRKKAAPTLVLWGDSHAFMMIPAIKAAIGDRRVNLAFFHSGGCPPMNPVLRPGESNYCAVYGTKIIEWLRRHQRAGLKMRLIIGNAWELYHNAISPPNRSDELYQGFTNDYAKVNAREAVRGLPRAFKALGRIGVRTDVVEPMPMVYNNAEPCARGEYECTLPRAGVLKDNRENLDYIRQMQGYLDGHSRTIRPTRALCDATTCRGRYAGLPVYYDQIHIGGRVSALLGQYFRPSVDNLLRRNR